MPDIKKRNRFNDSAFEMNLSIDVLLTLQLEEEDHRHQMQQHHQQ